MTPAENKALVLSIFEARSRRDPAPFMAAVADDFIWRITGSTAWSGEYVGKADLRERLLKPLHAQFVAPTSLTASRILADGDYVVAECKGDATTVSGERYANGHAAGLRLLVRPNIGRPQGEQRRSPLRAGATSVGWVSEA